MPSKRYFSYVRVSTQKQGQTGTSLAEQQAAIEQFADSWNLTISKRFEERETAAKQGRPVFLEMIKQLRKRDADGVIIHKIDRSARNLQDWVDVGKLIDSGVEVHFASESLDMKSRGGRLSADIQAVVASDYIRNLREETKKGMYGRLKQGLFPFRAPIGYLDRGKGLPKEIDPETGPLVRRAFELYASGEWSMATLPGKLNELGLRGRKGKGLTPNGLHTLLHNPFYAGRIRIEKTGELFPGIHRPLITEALFRKAQEVAEGRLTPRTKVHSFTFRRMLRCRGCGNLFIGETHKKKVYYRCHGRGCARGYLKEETITTAIGSEFKKLELQGREFELFKGLAAESVKDWKEESDRMRQDVLDRQATLVARKNRLVDSFVDSLIDKEDFNKRKVKLELEEAELRSRLDALGGSQGYDVSKFDEFLELANSAYLSFNSAPTDVKREMLDLLTSTLEADGKSVLIKLKSPFNLLAERPAIPFGSPLPNATRTFTAYLSRLLFEVSRVGLHGIGEKRRAGGMRTSA